MEKNLSTWRNRKPKLFRITIVDRKIVKINEMFLIVRRRELCERNCSETLATITITQHYIFLASLAALFLIVSFLDTSLIPAHIKNIDV